MGMSLLDIVGCALGAAVVLAVVFSVIRVTPPTLAPNEFILVETQGSWAQDNFDSNARSKNSIGFLVVTPTGKKLVVMPNSHGIADAKKLLVDGFKEANNLSLVSAKDIGSGRLVSYLSIDKPVFGRWEISPYYYNFPAWLSSDGQPKQREFQLRDLNMNVWTRSIQCEFGIDAEGGEAPSPLSKVGTGTSLETRKRTLIVGISETAPNCFTY
jgi:hypothetical protein